MDLKQLEYFVRVAELGSFTRAAHALGVAQPALSRQIRQLEVELRHNLLLRNGRGAVPTEAGKVLLAHGRGILHQVERAREELGRVRGSLAGHVSIGLPPSLARLLATPLVRAFRQTLPQATLAISEGLSTAMLDQIAQGHLDMALVYNPVASADHQFSPLFDETLVLVQAAGSPHEALAPITLAEVARLPLVIPRRPNAIRMQVESSLAALGLRPQVALEIDGVAAILELVADGVGVAVLSPHAVSQWVRPAVLRTRAIVDPPLRPRVTLATSAHRPATLTQQAAVALVRELCAQRFGPLLPQQADASALG